jgi:putative transposase
MKVLQAYRVALEPTTSQERALRSHAGAARFAWNWGLAKCKERYEAEGNRWLARAVADQGFGAAVRMLDYKTRWRGGQLVRADRWFPSSKTCSACGAVKAKLPLHVRVFSCEACGLVASRDENAARNLLSLAASGAERLNACGAAVRPGLAGRAAVNQEPGTASAGQTGTAAGQPAATTRSQFMLIES